MESKNLITNQTYEPSSVVKIMRDIEMAMRNGEMLNLGAGNPISLPETKAFWDECLDEVVSSEDFHKIMYSYGAGKGYEPFVDEIVEIFNQILPSPISDKNVILTAGSQLSCYTLVNLFTGDKTGKSAIFPIVPEYTGFESMFSNPNYIKSYKPLIKITGENRFKYQLDLESLVLDETVGCVMFSRPSNPSGNVISDDEISQLIQKCEQKNIPVIIDSAYSIPFPGLVYKPMNLHYGKNVILTYSFSKCGLPGERVGITIASEEVIEKLSNYQINTLIHSSRFGQALSFRALKNGLIQKINQQILNPTYQRKIKIVSDSLDSLIDKKVPWYMHEVDGGMFVWLWFKDLKIDDQVLYTKLKEQGIIVTPGNHFFFTHKNTWKHAKECIRISLTTTDEDLEAGLKILAKTVNEIY